jgi:hypothetical protein
MYGTLIDEDGVHRLFSITLDDTAKAALFDVIYELRNDRIIRLF